MSVFGILSIRNASGLGYPYLPVVSNLSGLCDRVLVGIDPRFPDAARVEELGLPNVSVVDAKWNDSNIDAGSEIALQMDRLVKQASSEGARWVVVLQADEAIHEKDFSMLRLFMERSPEYVAGFSMERLYFWRDLNTLRNDWSARLVRVFRPGTFSFMAEGTDKAGMYAGPIKKGDVIDLPFKIYHYSRVGDPSAISKRVRNLDGFFHEPDSLIPEEDLPSYDFSFRKWDNFSKIEGPPAAEGSTSAFSGTHPALFEDWYSG